MELLITEEQFSPVIWKCACGEKYLSKVLEQDGVEVISINLIYRGFGDTESLDFLKEFLENFERDIIINPPYKYAAFVACPIIWIIVLMIALIAIIAIIVALCNWIANATGKGCH